ncbi:MAG: protein kinase [Myxococcota bacterium]
MTPAYGPWRVEGPLGAGGMGVVHRVRHVDTGARAALKVVASPDPRARRAIRREAAALAQLHHPAIVGLVDDATGAEDEPWYAMELLDGPSLGAVIGRSPSRASTTWIGTPGPALDALEPSPAPADDRRRWVDAMRAPLARIAELCHALCHLHAAGFVHCDLKPDNVIVAGGRSVLVDFGLVTTRGPRIDRASIAHDAGIAGTAAYLSPERASGAEFDARADLYAIGCMLYQVVAGRPPFVARSALQVIAMHRERAPVRLADRADGVPPALDRLVEALLHKDPRDRPGHARQVIRVLADLGVEVPDWPLPAAAAVYQAALRGRDGVLEALDDDVDRLADQGGVGWITGESGAGKSRLVAALLARRGGGGPRIVTGGCSALQTADRPAPSGVPLELFADPIREVVDRSRRDPVLAAAIAEPLAVLSPWLGGRETDPAPPADTAAGVRHRVGTAAVAVLDAAFGRSPAVFVLDDLQWADDLSVSALEVLVRGTEPARGGRRWLVLGLIRAECDDAHLAHLFDHGRPIRVERLGEADVRAVVADMLGESDVPASLLGWVERHAAGNPLFVGECLRAAVASGGLRLDRDGRWGFDPGIDDLPAPASLDPLMAARLDPLSAVARAVVRAAAVIGREASLALLAAASGVDGPALDHAIDELVRRAIVDPERDARAFPLDRAGLSFVHDRLVERVYASIPADERQELHRRVAAALEAVDGDPAAIGWHHAASGDPDRAWPAYARAAARAAERLVLREAELRFGEAIALAPPAEADRLRIALVRAVLAPQGRAAEIERTLDGVVPADDARFEVALALGQAIGRTDRYDEALAQVDRARALAAGDARRIARVATEAASVWLRQGRTAEAVASQRQAIAALGPDADPVELAPMYQRLATGLLHLGAPAEAHPLLDRAIETFAAAGRPSGEAQARSVRGNVRVSLGRFDDAIDDYRAALALQRRIGNRASEGALLGNWASALTRLDRYAEAEAQYRAALAIHRETGDRWFEGVVTRSLAGFALLDARLEDALAGAEEARRVLAPFGNPVWLAHCDALRAKVFRYLGDERAALDALTREVDAYRAASARLELVDGLVHAIHHALAFGTDPTPAHDELVTVVASIGGGTAAAAELAKADGLLARARAGLELLAGEDPADLPAPLIARLRARGPVSPVGGPDRRR